MDASSPAAVRARMPEPTHFCRGDTAQVLQLRQAQERGERRRQKATTTPTDPAPLAEVHRLGVELGRYAGWRNGALDGFIVGVLVGLLSGAGLVTLFVRLGAGS